MLEPVLIRLFYDGLRLSICAKAEQKGCRKDTWDQAIKKAITAKAKAALNLPLWVHKIDSCCPQGHCSASKPTKDHTWDQDSFLFRPHKAQAMSPHYSEPNEIKRPCRDNQKGRRNRNCCNCGRRSSRHQGFTLATGVNTTKIPAQDNRDSGRNRPTRQEDKDLSQITYYNYNKKSYFANPCPESHKQKPDISLSDLLVGNWY